MSKHAAAASRVRSSGQQEFGHGTHSLLLGCGWESWKHGSAARQQRDGADGGPAQGPPQLELRLLQAAEPLQPHRTVHPKGSRLGFNRRFGDLSSSVGGFLQLKKKKTPWWTISSS